MTVQEENRIYRDAIEITSTENLRALQLERLKWTLHHAYENVPHYRSAFQAAGVHPDDLQSLEDLALFPFTSKNDLRDTYPFGMLALPIDKIARIHASSGTTGNPTVAGYSQQDLESWAEMTARSIYAAGGRPGDMVHIAYGYGLFTGGLGAHYGAEKLGCTVVPMSGGQTQKQVQLIQDFKPRIIMVTPSYMLNILDEFERQGLDPSESSLEIGIFGAEPWTHAMRENIEQRADIQAVDIYGLTEVMGPGIASECVETRDGPTVWEDHVYPEIINPDTGEVMPDGEPGELVFTTLTKEGMPVIRYRTRDLTRLGRPTARNMRRIERLTGRSDDMMIVRGVNIFPSQLEDIICHRPGLSPHFQIELSRKGNMDHMHIIIERASDFDNHSSEEETAGELRSLIKTHVGINVQITIGEIGSVVRSTGKIRRVFDNRFTADSVS